MFNPFKFIRNLFTRPAAVAPVDPFAGLMAKFNEATDPLAKWDVPFPMAVFGTLRANQGNHPLMGLLVGQESQGEVRNAWGRPLSDARYGRVMKTVLPNFAADGIHLVAWPGNCVFFEVYVYDTENFTKVLPRIDGLEGFRPGDADRSWYFRTLVNLRVLPDDFPTPERLGAVLDLPADIESLAIVPAWIYSSKQENERSLAVPGTPITWAGATVPPPPKLLTRMRRNSTTKTRMTTGWMTMTMTGTRMTKMTTGVMTMTGWMANYHSLNVTEFLRCVKKWLVPAIERNETHHAFLARVRNAVSSR